MKCRIDRQWHELTFLQVDLHHAWTPRTPSTPTHPTTAPLTSAANSNRDTSQQAPPPSGRPHVYNRNGGAPAPPQVRDYDHIPKLKLNIPSFEGRYIPDRHVSVRN